MAGAGSCSIHIGACAGVCARAAWLGRSAERRPRQTYIVVVAHSAMEVPNRHLAQPVRSNKRACACKSHAQGRGDKCTRAQHLPA